MVWVGFGYGFGRVWVGFGYGLCKVLLGFGQAISRETLKVPDFARNPCGPPHGVR